MVHRVPSQWSVRVLQLGDAWGFVVKPTAQTSLDAIAATALSPLVKFGPITFGLGTVTQLDPFQCSMNACAPTEPTAQASLGEIAATPFRLVWFGWVFGRAAILQEPAGLGVGLGVGVGVVVGVGVRRPAASAGRTEPAGP